MDGAVCKQTVKTLTRRRILAAYGLGLHCLHTSHKKGARLVGAYSVWWVFFMLLLSSADFFSKLTFSKVLTVLIWVQTVCYGYQQMTKVAEKGIVKLACAAL